MEVQLNTDTNSPGYFFFLQGYKNSDLVHEVGVSEVQLFEAIKLCSSKIGYLCV